MFRTISIVLKTLAVAGLLLCAQAGTVWAAEVTPASYPSNQDWMKDLSDAALITQLTIPGTHDSATDRGHCEKNSLIKPVIELVSCQTYQISDQLNMGIRFFDIRLAYEDSTLTFHHGPYYLEQHFEDALDAAMNFLEDHPSEFVIFLIKQEHTSESADDFWKRVNDQLSNYPSDLFYNEKVVPTVSEARGKIVVMGRANTSNLKGFHVSWSSNTTHYEGSDKDLVYVVEDHYSLNTVSTETKYREARQNISLARICSASGNPKTLYISFLSGEGDLSARYPTHFADYVNPHIYDWLKSGPAAGPRSGIIVMDYAGDSSHGGWKLLDEVINQNNFSNSN
jgi:1-phosphatidylinositol phosphodiesterase